MKPNIIFTFLLLLSIVAIRFGGDAIVANYAIQKNTYLANESPTLITQEKESCTSPHYYLANPELFQELSQFRAETNQHRATFWLKKRIFLADSLLTGDYVLSFDNLTYVELTLMDVWGNVIAKRKAGLFRKSKDLSLKDGRDHFIIHLDSETPYTLLLRVKHTKGYNPLYNFHLQTPLDYLKKKQHINLIYAFMEGAITALLLYIAFAWLVSRYRPYIWIFCFLLFIGFYSYGLQNQFIDIFFPNNPQLGWSLVSVFRNLAGISFSLLTIAFLNLKKISPQYYKLMLGLILLVVMTSIFNFINNYCFANFKQSNSINLFVGVVYVLFFSNLFISLWKKIDRMQRFLIYSVIFLIIGVSILIYCGLILKEQSIQYVSIMTQFFVLCITMILLIGIRLKIRKSELEHHQTTETIVLERTAELKKANDALYEQQIQLLQKNHYIETLIDEVNHRVKNNLQLLYSLGSLCRSDHGNQNMQPIQSMQDRIHAMMLVNQLLVYNQNSQLKLNILVAETVNYLRQMHDPEETIAIQVDVSQDWLVTTQTSIPLALIITELLTNSYKYAFPKGRVDSPAIYLSILKNEWGTTMRFEDNGVGAKAPAPTASFGIGLVKDLTRQIKGTVTIHPENGFKYLFELNNII
ncbi:7TM diverse intracellular signaling domain-containing protein [Sphingobacterium siyangense]|uniref:histidine kinase n=1 Tax=Sphingobacterium siyangense TaxID=459529 RepID=A0A562MJD2_9SPHI|nr:7TM diverse intracellular signaling domain-containing protein [Sphingobacterium siyangense]TWI19948.1 two-component sensor histidine kinase [Sphingobacterium siyangense]